MVTFEEGGKEMVAGRIVVQIEGTKVYELKSPRWEYGGVFEKSKEKCVWSDMSNLKRIRDNSTEVTVFGL